MDKLKKVIIILIILLVIIGLIVLILLNSPKEDIDEEVINQEKLYEQTLQEILESRIYSSK